MSINVFTYRTIRTLTLESPNVWKFDIVSKFIIIRKNTFLRNVIANNQLNQRYEMGSNNFWDNESEGNYWGDYILYYPDAIFNGDFWNTAYTIGSSLSADYFPLYSDVPSKPEISQKIKQF